MSVTKPQQLDKLDRLETTIARTIERLGELGARCESLQQKNDELEEKLTELRNHNNELSEQIVGLKAAGESDGKRATNEKETLKRIDRMLEKFGELQI